MKKPRLFLDTNVILDLLGEREPFYRSIAIIATLADKGRVILAVSALSYATVNYVLAKYESSVIVIDKLRKFKGLSQLCSLDESVIERSLSSNFKDFEDALQYHSALNAECAIILSRNAKDFKGSAIPVMSPDEYLKSLKTSS